METRSNYPVDAQTDAFLPCYKLVIDVDGNVSELNAALGSDLGYDPMNIPEGLKLTDLLTAGSRIFYQTHFFPLIKLHGSYDELFLTFKTLSGEDVPALLNAAIYSSAEGKRIVCAGLKMSRRNQYEQEILEARKQAEKALHDNARLKDLAAELEKSHEELEKRLRKVESHSKEQEQINSILSHELQEPLRKIALFSKMMLDQNNSSVPSNWNGFLSKIYHSSAKIKEMALSIQKYLGIGERAYSPKLLDVGDLVQRVAEQNASVAGDAGVEVHVAPDTPVIKGDPVLLEGLFTELFSNSVKFAHNSRKLEIRIEVDSIDENFYKKIGDRYKYMKYVRLRFIDNGSGFMPKYREEVFELFKKAHVFDEGLGFGLAYCRKVTDLHHGEIAANSELNRGTTISVLLPAAG